MKERTTRDVGEYGWITKRIAGRELIGPRKATLYILKKLRQKAEKNILGRKRRGHLMQQQH